MLGWYEASSHNKCRGVYSYTTVIFPLLLLELVTSKMTTFGNFSETLMEKPLFFQLVHIYPYFGSKPKIDQEQTYTKL